jgi:hypothetical protein
VDLVKVFAPHNNGNFWTSEVYGRLTDEQAADWFRISQCLTRLAAKYSMPQKLEAYQTCCDRITRFAFWPPEEVAREEEAGKR